MARERENNAECGTNCADPITAPQRSPRIGRGGKGKGDCRKKVKRAEDIAYVLEPLYPEDVKLLIGQRESGMKGK